MKAIVSVFARDAKGITAYITAALAEQNINILDISQTLMQGYFTMIMLVDLAECEIPGQLPEIYDGDFPAESKGCFAQAWSVGEMLRVYEAIDKNG